MSPVWVYSTFPICVLFLPFTAVPGAVMAGVLHYCVWALFTMALCVAQYKFYAFSCNHCPHCYGLPYYLLNFPSFCTLHSYLS